MENRICSQDTIYFKMDGYGNDHNFWVWLHNIIIIMTKYYVHKTRPLTVSLQLQSKCSGEEGVEFKVKVWTPQTIYLFFIPPTLSAYYILENS